MYKILSHKKSIKYYESLSDKTALRINKAVEKIRKNPFEGSHIKKLKGRLEGNTDIQLEI